MQNSQGMQVDAASDGQAGTHMSPAGPNTIPLGLWREEESAGVGLAVTLNGDGVWEFKEEFRTTPAIKVCKTMHTRGGK